MKSSGYLKLYSFKNSNQTMKPSYLILSIGFAVLLLLAEITLAQQNSTTHPYGGIPNESRAELPDWKSPLDFHNSAYFEQALFDGRADFYRARFDSLADFGSAQFDSSAHFGEAEFKKAAVFTGAQFDGRADFYKAQFSLAFFENARFDSRAGFEDVQFHWRAHFEEAEFKSEAVFRSTKFKHEDYFTRAKFKSKADFRYAQFDSPANFGAAQFDSSAHFGGVTFNSWADFSGAQFDSRTNFEEAEFKNDANFRSAKLRDKVLFTSATFNGASRLDFRYAELDSLVDFSLATLKNTLFIGTPKSSTAQKYDFMRAYLLPAGQDTISADTLKKTVQYPGAKIVLFGPVELNMQAEKLEFLALHESLDYYAKKDIISHLKETSFEGEKFSNARFELDYLLAKSTIYQKPSVSFEEYSWYHPVVWGQWFYKATMGLGYRPFRLLYWVAAINLLFAIVYILRPKMKKQINEYIDGTRHDAKDKQVSFSDSFINVFYFSFMLFFTFRLKRDVLTSFKTKEKRVVVFHWLLGLMVYISFLAFSKAGSVLHTLKSLFVG